MEDDGCDTFAALVLGMSLEDLHRHDHRVGHQVTEHLPVEDVRGTVIAGGREERVGWVERHATDGCIMVPECPVRLSRQIEVKPADSTIFSTKDDMIAARMDGHARDNTGA